MRNIRYYLAAIFAAALLLLFGGVVGYKHEAIAARFKAANPWDDTVNRSWNSKFKQVVTGESGQHAYFYAADNKGPMPLVISLHTWSSDYTQTDPLAAKVADMGWNYIHPDARGRNNQPAACLSDLVVSDIDEAIAYAKNNASVDASEIYEVGVSGGAYTSLGYYLRGKEKIKSVISWVPISDLGAWYWQSLRRSTGYDKDVMACTGSKGAIDNEEARKRSPLYWDIDKASLPSLSIFAGMDDGYKGSVPISHSVLFYNKLAAHLGAPEKGLVSHEQLTLLLARGAEKSSLLETLEDREVIYANNFANVSLKIFDGGHEMLVDHTTKELIRLHRN